MAERAPEAIRFGILPAPQYTSWDELVEVARDAEACGIDALWMSDHLMPAYGSPEGPCLECTVVLSAWAALTSRVQLGSMVLANPFRNPALTAKVFATLDHVSGGRAVLGIGGGWFEGEHAAYGFDFGRSAGDRLDRLDEAILVIRAMLGQAPQPGCGELRFYQPTAPISQPTPVRGRLPILIGGGGLRKTLRLVAQHADIWNTAGPIEDVRRQADALGEWCCRVGRPPAEIEWDYHVGPVAIRQTEAEGRGLLERQLGRMSAELPPGAGAAGPPALIAEALLPFLQLGFRSFYFDLFPPYDRESLNRLVEVRALLARSD